MNALIKISSSEFNEDVFQKIKSMVKAFGNSEITIAVNESENPLYRKESKEEYLARVNQSINEIESGKGTVFTMEELEDYIHKLPG